jgi:hypothetical protein
MIIEAMRVNGYTSLVLSLALNSCLLWLIQWRTPMAMRVYSRTLVQTCVVNILFSLRFAADIPVMLFFFNIEIFPIGNWFIHMYNSYIILHSCYSSITG